MTTKRLLILLVSLTLPLATVGVALGAPEKDCTDPKWRDHAICTGTTTTTTTATPGGVDLSITQHLDDFSSLAGDSSGSVHEAGDLIIYSISGTNDSGGPIDLTDNLTGFAESGVPTGTFGPYVREYSLELDAIEWHDKNGGSVTNTVTASGPGGLIADASVSAGFWPVEQCDFSTPTTTAWTTCIWKPPYPGDWEVTIDPTPLGRGSANYQLTLRDHVPGNWCPIGLSGRWRVGDDPVSTIFSIPDWNQIPPGDPVCEIGGNGGDFFKVGTPGSFYLVAIGDVEVRYLGP